MFFLTHVQYLNIGSDNNSFPKESSPVTFRSNNKIDVSFTTAIWNHTLWVYKSLYWYCNKRDVEISSQFHYNKKNLSTLLQRSGFTEHCITASRLPSIEKKPSIFEG